MNSISFMPYFPDPEVDETFGDFRLWNWLKWKTKYVSDPSLIAFLDPYFAIYKRADGKQEDRIAIVENTASGVPVGTLTLPPPELGRFTASAMLAHLALLPVDPHNALFVSSPDSFIAFYQPFDVNTPGGVSLEFGSYFKMHWAAADLKTLSFVTPQYILDPTPAVRDDSLLANLAKACGVINPELDRLFRSLDWVRFAFNNAPEYPFPARIVAMTTAFEILLDLPDEKKGHTLL
jgi:hypothetical protein